MTGMTVETSQPRNVGLLVVGGGLAGCTAARRLHEAGHAVTVVDGDPDAPYDRPSLTKTFLTDDSDLAASPAWAPSDVAWLRDVALEVDPATGSIRLASGATLRADVLLVATGASARVLPGRSPRIVTVRSAADARALRDLRRGGARSFLVEGAGPLGLELASALVHDGADVTVVEASGRPMVRLVGEALAAEVARWTERAGVDLRLSACVETVTDGPGPRAVEAALSDGTRLVCDVMVSSVGSEAIVPPGIGTASGLVVDDRHRVLDPEARPWPGVYALGDVVLSAGPDGRLRRSEAWTAAIAHADTAVRDILGQEMAPASVPYFWTRQFGRMVQVLGIVPATGQAKQVAEVAATGGRLFQVLHGGAVTAYIGVNAQRLVARLQMMTGDVGSWVVPAA